MRTQGRQGEIVVSAQAKSGTGRRFMALAAALLLAACHPNTLLGHADITIDGKREAVFAAMIDEAALERKLPRIRNSGGERVFRRVIRKTDPEWASLAHQAENARSVTYEVVLKRAREATISYRIDDELAFGWRFQLSAIDNGRRTRVVFDVLPGSHDPARSGDMKSALKAQLIARDILARAERAAS